MGAEPEVVPDDIEQLQQFLGELAADIWTWKIFTFLVSCVIAWRMRKCNRENNQNLYDKVNPSIEELEGAIKYRKDRKHAKTEETGTQVCSGHSAKQLKDVGCEARELLDAGYTVHHLKEGGYSLKEVWEAGCSLDDI